MMPSFFSSLFGADGPPATETRESVIHGGVSYITVVGGWCYYRCPQCINRRCALTGQDVNPVGDMYSTPREGESDCLVYTRDMQGQYPGYREGASVYGYNPVEVPPAGYPAVSHYRHRHPSLRPLPTMEQVDAMIQQSQNRHYQQQNMMTPMAQIVGVVEKLADQVEVLARRVEELEKKK